MIKINNETIYIDLFPNGEMLVNTDFLNSLNEPFKIQFKFYENKDILELLFILAHLKDMGKTDYELYIYYMPYSRMDRNQNDNCFSLKYVIDLIKTFVTGSIYVIEPHSDVTLELLNAKRINIITPLMNKILEINPEIDMICYPDKGAKQRFQDDNVKLPVVFCNKIRDFDTGNILGLELDGEINVKDKNILILDDLCSKGGTFYHTANKLKESGAKDIYLGVCHMEYTVLSGKILDYCNNITPIKYIYCLDTMLKQWKSLELSTNAKNIIIYDVDKFLKNNELEEVKL